MAFEYTEFVGNSLLSKHTHSPQCASHWDADSVGRRGSGARVPAKPVRSLHVLAPVTKGLDYNRCK